MSGGAFSFKSESDTPAADAGPRDTVSSAGPVGPAPTKSDALGIMAQLAAHKPPPMRKASPPTPKHPNEPGKFEPGKKPTPRSGHTVHDVFRDPGKLKELHAKVKAWESANPKRKIKGPDVKGMFPTMSEAQARNVARRIGTEHQKLLGSKVQAYLGKGAKASLGGKP